MQCERNRERERERERERFFFFLKEKRKKIKKLRLEMDKREALNPDTVGFWLILVWVWFGLCEVWQNGTKVESGQNK